MSELFAVPMRTACAPARSRLSICAPPLAALAVALLCSLPSPSARAAGMTATDILTKVNQVYTSARSYTGHITLVEQANVKGKTASVSTSGDIKYKAPAQFAMTLVSVSRNGPTKQAKVIKVCDGRTAYAYSPDTHLYQKQPVSQPVSLAVLLAVIPRGNLAGSVLLPDTRVQGHAAFVVRLPQPKMPTLPATMSAADKATFKARFAAIRPPEFVIDKSSFMILGMTQKAGVKQTSVAFGAQSLNGVIPDNAFAFVPPPGAKEVKIPTAPPGAMAPPGGAKH